MAIRHLRAQLPLHLLPRYPALGSWSPGAERIFRRHCHAACGLGRRRRHHGRRCGVSGVVGRGAGRVRRQRRRSPDSKQRSPGMIVSFIRGPMIAVAFGLILGPAGVSAEQECSVPERFYTYEPPLKKTPKALAGSRPLVIATLGGASSVGVAAGGTELACEARCRTTGSRCPVSEADAPDLGDRHDGGSTGSRR